MYVFKQTGSLVSGVGTSLVLTQTEIVFYSHYPRHSRSAAISHLVPYLGSSVAQFSMPLLLLGFLSLYGTHEASLLQAGLVLHGLVGVLTLRPPTQRPPSTSRYRLRPRAFSFVNDDSLYTSTSSGYSSNRYACNYICDLVEIFMNNVFLNNSKAPFNNLL